jgi:hypothetical protein
MHQRSVCTIAKQVAPTEIMELGARTRHIVDDAHAATRAVLARL